jgi:hypothetical protein
MSRLEDTFTNLESHRFSALVNVASNLKTFLRALAAQPEVQQLAETMQAAEARARVSERVSELIAKDVDKDFEHPGDSALAPYVWLLSTRDEALARIAATRIGRVPPVLVGQEGGGPNPPLCARRHLPAGLGGVRRRW